MPVLGRPSLEESYLSLANQSPARAKQGEVKGGRGGAPTRKISFVSSMVYGPKVFLLSLSHGGLQLLKPGRVVPNIQPPELPGQGGEQHFFRPFSMLPGHHLLDLCEAYTVFYIPGAAFHLKSKKHFYLLLI